MIPPTNIELALHKDWIKTYGSILFKDSSFIYNNVDFEEIAKANRN